MAQTSEIHLLPSWFPANRPGRPDEGQKRALVVTDRFLFNNGYADR
ncbi:hypothetical protein ACLK19_08455 [Escherichia coli]